MSFLSDPYDPCSFLVGGVGVTGDIVFLIPLLSYACNKNTHVSFQLAFRTETQSITLEGPDEKYGFSVPLLNQIDKRMISVEVSFLVFRRAL